MKKSLVKTLALSVLLVGMSQGCSMSSGIRYKTTKKEFTIEVAKNDLIFWNRTWPLTDEHYFPVSVNSSTGNFFYDNSGNEDAYKVIVKNVYYKQYTDLVLVLDYTVEYKEKVKTINNVYDSTAYESFKVVDVQPMSS